VPPTGITGLETITDSIQGDPYRYFASYPAIAGFPLLGETLGTLIAGERGRFEDLRGPFEPVPPEASGPSFNASFEFVVASGDVIGVQLLFYEFFGANGMDRSIVTWFDLATGEALAATALLDAAALSAVAAEIRAAVLADYGSLVFADDLDRVLADPELGLRTIGFSDDGDLVVVFDEYSIAPGSLGQISIALPADIVEPHLSEFGRRARAETLQPTGSPQIPPPPTATAEPTSTPSPPSPPPTMPPPPVGEVDCAEIACVALTFDDGPAGHTARLLDVLARADVPATFFVVGLNAEVRGDLLARMVGEGHEVGNHTYDHRDLTTLGPDEIRGEVDVTAQIVAGATGARPVLVRPPYGAYNEAVRGAVAAPLILWSVDPRDWADRDAEVVIQRVLERTGAGDIVLLHDIHGTSVDAVPAIIEGLRERGLTFVTVSTLLGDALTPGSVYRSGR